MTGSQQPRSTPAAEVCGSRAYLPTELVAAALALETSTERPAAPEDVERHLRCTLQEHSRSGISHHGLVLELDGPDTGSVWTLWQDGSLPSELVVLPDCPGAGTDEPCNEYAGHPGGHSHELRDPLAQWVSAAVGQ